MVALLLAVYWGPWPSDVLIITSERTRLDALVDYQLKSIYLGSLDQLKGVRLTPCQVRSPHDLRTRFESRLFGKDFDLDSYWVNEQLKGGVRPPLTFGDEAILMAIVARNPGFIGYVSLSQRENLKRFHLKELTIRSE